MNFSKLNAILNWSVRVGRLFGIPVSLHISLLFFLFPLLRGNSLGVAHTLEFIGLVIGSILLHELGHALTAKHYKLTGLSIMLHGFGGFATSSGYRSPSQALRITLAGPAVTFAVGIICLTISFFSKNQFQPGSEASIQRAIIHVVGSLNILLGVLNLFPSFPFDGGNALHAILNRKRSHLKSTRVVGHFGLVLSPLLIIYWAMTGDSFVGLFGLMGTVASVQTLLNSGGIRFREFFDDRRAAKEMQAQKKREQERSQTYLDDVYAREKEREEKERLRKMFEIVDGSKDD
jgi:Zn-dependent protease